MCVCALACACTCKSKVSRNPPSWTLRRSLTCSRSTRPASTLLRLRVRKSVNGRAEATGPRRSVRKGRRWGEPGGWGGGGGCKGKQATHVKGNFLLCKHSFHGPCLLPSSQTGVNLVESHRLSQSSCSLLRFSLPPFSVSLNILSSPVTAGPVCIPLCLCLSLFPHLLSLSHFLSCCLPGDIRLFTCRLFPLSPSGVQLARGKA